MAADAPRWRHAWVLVLVAAAAAIVNGAFLLTNGDAPAREAHLMRLVGVGELAVGAVSAIGILAYRREPARAAWTTLWVLPAMLAGSAAVLATGDGGGLAGYYAALALLAASGLALARS